MTPEGALKKAIKDYLDFRGIFHFSHLAGLGSYRGLCDMQILHEGKAYFVEIKAERGVLSEYQKQFLANVEKAGCIAVVARELEDIIVLFDHAFPKLKIHS